MLPSCDDILVEREKLHLLTEQMQLLCGFDCNIDDLIKVRNILVRQQPAYVPISIITFARPPHPYECALSFIFRNTY